MCRERLSNWLSCETPEADGAIFACRREAVAMRSKGHRSDRRCLLRQLTQPLALPVPNIGVPITSASENVRPILANIETGDTARVNYLAASFSPDSRIPNT
jgi:hypothetical protein